jgi:cytidylate kinase
MNDWYRKFAERVIQRQNITDELVERAGRGEIEFQPFVTISRDPGSGGRPIGKMVAKALGFKFYDNELLDEIAKSAKLRTEVIQQVDEKTRSGIQDLIQSLLNPDYISEAKFITHLARVELSLAQKGKVVLLGRGSNFVTPRAFGLHVRLTAPYRVCVARAVRYEKVSQEEARKRIQKTTKDRAGFVKQYFGKNIANSKYYDLVLNTTYMDLQDAVDIITTAYKRKFP